MSEKVTSADNQQGRLSEKLTPDYIVGIVDGEGYFSVSAIVDRSQGYDNYNVRLVFGIKLNAEDGEILHIIRNYFGCGTVRFRKDERKENPFKPDRTSRNSALSKTSTHIVPSETIRRPPS